MHIFMVSFYAAGVLYAIFNEPILLAYFLFFVGGYIAISATYKDAKNVGSRKKIMMSTWKQPQQGVINVKLTLRTEKVQKIINESPKDQKLTMTHFVIKAAGELLNAGRNDLNGKLVFGKYVPHKTCDVSCLVNLDGGNDLAVVLIKETQRKSVKEIADFIRQKGRKMQEKKGDQQHKKRTQSATFLPAFLVSFMIEIASFLTNKLGISIPPLGLKKDAFGAAVVTSIGAFGFDDAVAPFSGLMNAVFFLSACSVHQAPVIEDGKVVPGRVINLNFAADHRYIDGGKAKLFPKVIKDVFQNPEKYAYQNPNKQQ